MKRLIRSGRTVRLIFAVMLVVYVALGIHTQSVTLARVNPPKFMEDYDIFNQAFQRAANGMDPYQIREPGLNFLYPPPSLFVFAIFELIPADTLRIALYLLSNFAALGVMVWRVSAHYGYSLKKTWWWFPLAFGFAPFLELLYVGQINMITEFGVLLMFIFAETTPFIAGLGLWLGIVTKVTPSAFFVYLVVARHWRASFWTLAILLVSLIASTLVFGLDSFAKFFQVLASLQSTFYGEYDSQSLASIFISRGWLKQGTWTLFQNTLNDYIVALCLTSAALAWRSRQSEALFIILSFATTIVPSNLWYNRYVLLLLPIFVWMASSRFNQQVIAWCLTGLVIAQIDRQPLGQGLFINIFAHASMIALLGWQFSRAYRLNVTEARLALAGFVIALVFIIAIPFQSTLSLNANLIKARDWMQSNLPAGSRIAYDATAPPVLGEKFTGELVPAIIAQSPDWYERNGYEYLVFSSETFGLALRDPSSTSAKQYAAFFDRFYPIALFQNGQYEIRIYQTNPTRLPRQRDSHRFGIFSEWLEFVGYDLTFPRIELFWRVVQPRREPIDVTIRLLDTSDRLVDQVDTLLFTSDKRSTQEIVSQSIIFPSTHPTGIYKIELGLDAEVSGGIPVLSAKNEPIADSLIIDSIKITPVPPSLTQLDSARVLNARFGDSIILSRYSLERKTLSTSEPLILKVYWLCETKAASDYTVFVHLVDSLGKLVAQTDAPPLGGAYPTSSWDAGEIISDDIQLIIPSDLASGEYRLQVGMYDSSLVRLKVSASNGEPIGDYVSLDSVAVK